MAQVKLSSPPSLLQVVDQSGDPCSKRGQPFQDALNPTIVGQYRLDPPVPWLSQFQPLGCLAQFTRLSGGLNPESSSIVTESILDRANFEPMSGKGALQYCDNDMERLV